MSRTLQVRYQFNGGESEHEFQNAGNISPRSYNFLPDRRGFLRTYRGKRSMYTPSPPDDLSGKWVNAGKVFVDVFGRRRHVIVAGRDIYSIDGKVFTLLFSYPADIGLDDGNAHVTIIEHNAHVIFLHPGYPPLKWNGDEPVNWVGVREVPQQPEVHSCHKHDSIRFYPFYGVGATSTERNIMVWGAMRGAKYTNNVIYAPPVYLQDDQVVGEEGISAIYRWKVAFQNSNGQVGRWSAPIEWHVSSTGDGGAAGTAEEKEQRQINERIWPIIEWFRPEDLGPTGIGTDVVKVWLARTGNTVADADAGAFFVQGVYPFTQNRTTDNKAGLSLAIDEDNYPPEKTSIGCIFKDKLVISGNRADPYGVWYSKSGAWESFPPLNYYRATDNVTAVLPLSDRIVVVTESTIEVLAYDANTQTFGLFRKDDRRGSILGRSLVVYKDNVFGLFTDGYGLFDGFQYKGVDSDQDELFSYIDRHNADRIRAIVDPKSGYWCTINFDAKTSEGNTMLLFFDFTRNAWYRIIDTNIMSMWYDDEDIIVGGFEDIHFLDMGKGSGHGALLEIAKTEFSETDSRASVIFKTVRSVYLLAGSTAHLTSSVDFYADENLTNPIASGTFSLLGSSDASFQDTIMDGHWNESIWDDPESKWSSPRRAWQKIVDFDDTVRFYSVRTSIVVPGLTYAEIAGIGYDLEVDRTHAGLP